MLGETEKEELGCMKLRMNLNENSNQDYLLSSNNLLRKLMRAQTADTISEAK